MSLFSNFIKNAAKPSDTFLGKMMLKGMNYGHQKMALWCIDNHIKLSGNEDVLDIGCGGGQNITNFLKRTNGKVYGIDYSLASVEKSLKKNKKAVLEKRSEIVQANVSAIPFEDEAFDLASGGSISNLIALTAARDKHKIKNEKIPKSVVYLSHQAHHCIHKALRIIGLEDVIIRYTQLDEFFKINSVVLENQIKSDKKNGLNPFLVIASAGTTDVGAIDPLNEIAEISKKHKLWFHVDAAYGGFFILTSKKDLFKGIEKADSIVVDPHKGMFLPYGLGAVLIKDAKAVLHSHHYSANYMQDAATDDLLKSPANISPELTKHFRGLRLWLPLQLHGLKPFIACLEEKLLLTRYFREKLKTLGFNVGPEPDLSVSYFWYPVKSNQNEFNKRLMDYIHQDGSVFLSSTILDNKFVIRMAILSFRTKKATIDKALTMIEKSLKKTKKEFKINSD
jgi:aromatic-L-amino-acid decarboxylase